MYKLLLVCLFVAFVSSNPVIDSKSAENQQHLDNSVHERSQGTNEEALIKRLNLKCAQKDTSACVMLKLIFYMNRMLKKTAIELNENIEITKTSSELDIVESRSFDENNANLNANESENSENSDETQVGDILADKVMRFVRTRSLKWKVMDDADLVISGAPDKDGIVNVGLSLKTGLSDQFDARRRRNNLGPLIAAAAMKIGLLKVLAIKGLALIAGKALIISKIALVISVIIGLKKLFSQQKHVTYEVVSHPHHTHSEPHSSGQEASGWGRSLAYRAHSPNSESIGVHNNQPAKTHQE